jgi:hypothetical protein
MIKVFNNPFLGDFIQIAARLPKDEREQIEIMTGSEYDVDGAAVGNYMVPGPKWIAKLADSEEDFESGNTLPICVGGFVEQRPGVWRDFLLTTPEAFPDYALQLTRFCKKAMDAMLHSGQAHRLECVVPAARLQSRPELEKWYKILGYNKEGLRYGYCANGADAVAFSRVRH